ncbi:unnamed protein product [Aphanomyces euteiches]|nr:hypothetical protein Ae201684P_018559 [Aphanomyces euteiches]
MQSSLNTIKRTWSRAWCSTANGPTFRVATHADINAVIALTKTTSRYAMHLKRDCTSPTLMAKLGKSSHGGVLVAQAKRQIIGSICVEKPDKLTALTVHKEWRNQDIGSKLIQSGGIYAKQDLVRTSRPDLFDFYLGCGVEFLVDSIWS